MSTAIADLKGPASAPAERKHTILDLLANPKVSRGIKDVCGQYMTGERFLRFAVNAVNKTPKLMLCDPKTVLGGFMASAALALEPNTVQQQAWLIPYKKRGLVDGKWIDVYECQFQIGARGFVTLAYRSPLVKRLQYDAVHENDVFDHMVGSESFLKYSKALRNRGELIASFCYVRLADGEELATVLPIDEIMRIRSKSETFKSLSAELDAAATEKDRLKAQRKFDEQPWVLWEDDMAAKSAIKKGAKQMPLHAGDPLGTGATIDQDAADSVMDLGAMSDPDLARAVARGEEEPPQLRDEPSGEAFSTLDTRAAQPRAESAASSTVEAENRADAAATRAAQDARAPTVREIEDRLDSAGTLDDLERAEKLIDDIPDPGAEQHLREKAAALRARFERSASGRRRQRPSAE